MDGATCSTACPVPVLLVQGLMPTYADAAHAGMTGYSLAEIAE